MSWLGLLILVALCIVWFVIEMRDADEHQQAAVKALVPEVSNCPTCGNHTFSQGWCAWCER